MKIASWKQSLGVILTLIVALWLSAFITGSAFHHQQRLHHSYVRWEWVQETLFMERYNGSVAPLLDWTGATAVRCALLSLAVSLVYIVRRIYPLHDLHGGDTLRSRVLSFNARTGAFLWRDWMPDSACRVARRLFATLLFICAAASSSVEAAQEAQESAPFRFGFSSTMLANVNHNDAVAAVKVWSQIVAKERGVSADPDPLILSGVKEISDKTKDKMLDAVAVTMLEFREMKAEQFFSDFFLASQGGRTNVEYLLLVRRDNPAQDVSGLKGLSLGSYDNPRNSLALTWLDIMLMQQRFEPVNSFFGRVTRSAKLSAVVLPVFFRQSDACVVDRQSFETLCELNPQIGKQLKTLAVSPPVVPMVFCIRTDYSSSLKNRIMDALARLHTSPAGRQVLEVLKFERIVPAGSSCLTSAIDMMNTHAELRGKAIERSSK